MSLLLLVTAVGQRTEYLLKWCTKLFGLLDMSCEEQVGRVERQSLRWIEGRGVSNAKALADRPDLLEAFCGEA